jgi:hypothetical protein
MRATNIDTVVDTRLAADSLRGRERPAVATRTTIGTNILAACSAADRRCVSSSQELGPLVRLRPDDPRFFHRGVPRIAPNHIEEDVSGGGHRPVQRAQPRRLRDRAALLACWSRVDTRT